MKCGNLPAKHWEPSTTLNNKTKAKISFLKVNLEPKIFKLFPITILGKLDFFSFILNVYYSNKNWIDKFLAIQIFLKIPSSILLSKRKRKVFSFLLNRDWQN